MSQQPTNLDPQIAGLEARGLSVEIRENHLLVTNVPYVGADGTIKRGSLVDALVLNGNELGVPAKHTIWWIGEHPHRASGQLLESIVHSAQAKQLTTGIKADHQFSAKPKPTGKYDDFKHKFEHYYEVIAREAFKKDPSLKPARKGVTQTKIDPHPFRYVDTASLRTEIVPITDKLRGQRIAIVGLGGTGSYVLDFVAKNPVEEIHLFDGDAMEQHNAFRAPGAVSLTTLEQQPSKVVHHCGIYDAMHTAIMPHPNHLTRENMGLIDAMDFVFLCLDDGQARREIVDHLVAEEIPFIDTGAGVNRIDDELIGMVRATLVTPDKNNHIDRCLPFHDNEANEYDSNIQIAELNALNAALAVIRWKRFNGIYRTIDNEYDLQFSTLDHETFKEEHALD